MLGIPLSLLMVQGALICYSSSSLKRMLEQAPSLQKLSISGGGSGSGGGAAGRQRQDAAEAPSVGCEAAATAGGEAEAAVVEEEGEAKWRIDWADLSRSRVLSEGSSGKVSPPPPAPGGRLIDPGGWVLTLLLLLLADQQVLCQFCHCLMTLVTALSAVSCRCGWGSGTPRMWPSSSSAP